jgi:hypothetical protein
MVFDIKYQGFDLPIQQFDNKIGTFFPDSPFDLIVQSLIIKTPRPGLEPGT